MHPGFHFQIEVYNIYLWVFKYQNSQIIGGKNRLFFSCLPSLSCLLVLRWQEEKCPFLCLYSALSIGELYRAFGGELFEAFFPFPFDSGDGFLTLPNEDLAGFTPGTCVFALIFMPFGPLVAGRKVPFFFTHLLCVSLSSTQTISRSSDWGGAPAARRPSTFSHLLLGRLRGGWVAALHPTAL